MTGIRYWQHTLVVEVDGAECITSGLRDVRGNRRKLFSLISGLAQQERDRRRETLTTVDNLLWDDLKCRNINDGHSSDGHSVATAPPPPSPAFVLLMRIAVAAMDILVRRIHVVVSNSAFTYNDSVRDSGRPGAGGEEDAGDAAAAADDQSNAFQAAGRAFASPFRERRNRRERKVRPVGGFAATIVEVSVKGSKAVALDQSARSALGGGGSLSSKRASEAQTKYAYASAPGTASSEDVLFATIGGHGARDNSCAAIKIAGIDAFIFTKLAKVGTRGAGQVDASVGVHATSKAADMRPLEHQRGTALDAETIIESCRVIHAFGLEGRVRLLPYKSSNHEQQQHDHHQQQHVANDDKDGGHDDSQDEQQHQRCFINICMSVSMKSPLITVTTSAIQTLTSTVVSMCVNGDYYKYHRRPKPSTRVVDAPVLWWQYAVGEIVMYIRKHRQVSAATAMALMRRRTKRRQYIKAYLPLMRGMLLTNGRNPFTWIIWSVRRSQLRARIDKLECALSVEDVTSFRWWALAMHLSESLRYTRRRSWLAWIFRGGMGDDDDDERHGAATELLMKDRALLKVLTVAPDSILNNSSGVGSSNTGPRSTNAATAGGEGGAYKDLASDRGGVGWNGPVEICGLEFAVLIPAIKLCCVDNASNAGSTATDGTAVVAGGGKTLGGDSRTTSSSSSPEYQNNESVVFVIKTIEASISIQLESITLDLGMRVQSMLLHQGPTITPVHRRQIESGSTSLDSIVWQQQGHGSILLQSPILFGIDGGEDDVARLDKTDDVFCRFSLLMYQQPFVPALTARSIVFVTDLSITVAPLDVYINNSGKSQEHGVDDPATSRVRLRRQASLEPAHAGIGQKEKRDAAAASAEPSRADTEDWKKVCALIKSIVDASVSATSTITETSDVLSGASKPTQEDKFKVLYGLETIVIASLCRHHVPRRPTCWVFPPIMTITVKELRVVLFPSGKDSGAPPLVVQIRGNHLDEMDDGKTSLRRSKSSLLGARIQSKKETAADALSPGSGGGDGSRSSRGHRQHLIIQSVSSDDLDEQWIDMHQIDINNKKRMLTVQQHEVEKRRQRAARRKAPLLLLPRFVRSILARLIGWRVDGGGGVGDSDDNSFDDESLSGKRLLRQVSQRKQMNTYSHQNIAWTRKKWYIHIGVDVALFFASASDFVHDKIRAVQHFEPSRSYNPTYDNLSTVLRLKVVNVELNFVDSMLPAASSTSSTSSAHESGDPQEHSSQLYRTTSEMRLRITTSAIRVVHVTDRIIQRLTGVVVDILDTVSFIAGDMGEAASTDDTVVNEVIFFMSCEVPFVLVNIQNDMSTGVSNYGIGARRAPRNDATATAAAPATDEINDCDQVNEQIENLCRVILSGLSFGLVVDGLEQRIQLRMDNMSIEDTRAREPQRVAGIGKSHAKRRCYVLPPAPRPSLVGDTVVVNRPIQRWWWALDVLLWRKWGRKAGFNIVGESSGKCAEDIRGDMDASARRRQGHVCTWLRPFVLSRDMSYQMEPIVTVDVRVDDKDVGVGVSYRWLTVNADVSFIEQMTQYAMSVASAVTTSLSTDDAKSTSTILGQGSSSSSVVSWIDDLDLDANKTVVSTHDGASMVSRMSLDLEVSFLRAVLKADDVDFSSVQLENVSMVLASEDKSRSKSVRRVTPYRNGGYYEHVTDVTACRSTMKMNIVAQHLAIYDWIVAEDTVADGLGGTLTIRQPRAILHQGDRGGQLDLALEVVDECRIVSVMEKDVNSRGKDGAASAGTSGRTGANGVPDVKIVPTRNKVSVSLTLAGLQFVLLLRYIDDLVFVVNRLVDCFGALGSSSSSPSDTTTTKPAGGELESAAPSDEKYRSSLEVSIIVDELDVIFPRNSLTQREGLVIDIDRVEMFILDDTDFSIDVINVCGYAVEKFRPSGGGSGDKDTDGSDIDTGNDNAGGVISTYQLLENTDVGISIETIELGLSPSMAGSHHADSDDGEGGDKRESLMQTRIAISVGEGVVCHFGRPQYNTIMSIVYEHLTEELNFGKVDATPSVSSFDTSDAQSETEDVASIFNRFAFGVSMLGIYPMTAVNIHINKIVVAVEAFRNDDGGGGGGGDMNGTMPARPMLTRAGSKMHVRVDDTMRLLTIGVTQLAVNVMLFDSISADSSHPGRLTASDVTTHVEVSMNEIYALDVRYDIIQPLQRPILQLKGGQVRRGGDDLNGNAKAKRRQGGGGGPSSILTVSVVVRKDETVAVEVVIDNVLMFVPYLALLPAYATSDHHTYCRNSALGIQNLVNYLGEMFSYTACDEWLAHTEQMKQRNPGVDMAESTRPVPWTYTNIIVTSITGHIPVSYSPSLSLEDRLRMPNEAQYVMYLDIDTFRCLLLTGGTKSVPETKIVLDVVDLSIGRDIDVVGGMLDGGAWNIMVQIKQEDREIQVQHMLPESVEDRAADVRGSRARVDAKAMGREIDHTTDIVVDVNVFRDINITSAFSHVPLIRELVRAIFEEVNVLSPSDDADSNRDATAASSCHDDDDGASHMQSYHVSANKIFLSGVHWRLVDDRSISPAKPVVFIAGITQTTLKFSLHYQTPISPTGSQETSVGTIPTHRQEMFVMSGKFSQILYVKHLNSTFESVIDTIDPWPFMVQFEDMHSSVKGMVEDIWFESNHRLNVYYAHSLLRAIADVETYANLLVFALTAATTTGTAETRGEPAKDLADTIPRPDVQDSLRELEDDPDNDLGTSSYTIVNHSGLMLYYGTDIGVSPAGRKADAAAAFAASRPGNKIFKVHNNDADILRVDPAVKDMYTKSKNRWDLRRGSHSIVLWFEGCWTPTEIIIDRVGKTKYDILSPTETTMERHQSAHDFVLGKGSSPSGTGAETRNGSGGANGAGDERSSERMLKMHVVVDVVLYGRNKVIHVHSSLWIQNLTKFPLGFKLYIPKVPVALKRKAEMLKTHRNMSNSTSFSAGSRHSSKLRNSKVPRSMFKVDAFSDDEDFSLSTLYMRLEPGQGGFLPLYAMLDGLLYVKISNDKDFVQKNRKHELKDEYGWSERDVIHLSGEAKKLKRQQGFLQINYENKHRGKQYHESKFDVDDARKAELTRQLGACLEICLSRKGEESGVEEFVLNFRAPLIIRNALPYSVEITLDNHDAPTEAPEDDEDTMQKLRKDVPVRTPFTMITSYDAFRGISAGHHWGFYDISIERDVRAVLVLEESYRTLTPFILHRQQEAIASNPTIKTLQKQSDIVNTDKITRSARVRSLNLSYAPAPKTLKKHVLRAMQLKQLDYRLRKLRSRRSSRPRNLSLKRERVVDTGRMRLDVEAILARINANIEKDEEKDEKLESEAVTKTVSNEDEEEDGDGVAVSGTSSESVAVVDTGDVRASDKDKDDDESEDEIEHEIDDSGTEREVDTPSPPSSPNEGKDDDDTGDADENDDNDDDELLTQELDMKNKDYEKLIRIFIATRLFADFNDDSNNEGKKLCVPRLSEMKCVSDRWKMLVILYQEQKTRAEKDRHAWARCMWQRGKVLALETLVRQRYIFANDVVARRATGNPPHARRLSAYQKKVQKQQQKLRKQQEQQIQHLRRHQQQEQESNDDEDDEEHTPDGPLSAVSTAQSIDGRLSYHVQLEMSTHTFGDSGAREVTLYAPVLLVNKTKVVIHVKQHLGRNFLVLTPSSTSRGLSTTNIMSEALPLPVLYIRDTHTQIRAVVDDDEVGTERGTKRARVTEWSDRMQFSGIGLKQAISLKTPDARTGPARKVPDGRKRPQYDIGIEIVRSPKPFSNSLLVIFKDHHIFENLTNFDIEYKQRGGRIAGDDDDDDDDDDGQRSAVTISTTTTTHIIKSGERKAFHWDDIMSTFTVVVRPVGSVRPLHAQGDDDESSGNGAHDAASVTTSEGSASDDDGGDLQWHWSGGFSLDIEAQTGLRVDAISSTTRTLATDATSSDARRNVIIPCDVTSAHGYLLTTFLQPGRSAPYRIENQASDCDVRFHQLYNRELLNTGEEKTEEEPTRSGFYNVMRRMTKGRVNETIPEVSTGSLGADVFDDILGSPLVSGSTAGVMRSRERTSSSTNGGGSGNETSGNGNAYPRRSDDETLKEPVIFTVPPKSSTEYGWDEPLQDHNIILFVGDEQRICNLDEIGKTYEPITIKAPASTNIGRVSRTYSTSLNLKGKLKKILMDEGYRKLYISIAADGPTRVLKISDEKNEAVVYREKNILAVTTYIKELRDELQEIYNSFPNSEELLYELLVAKLEDMRGLRDMSRAVSPGRNSIYEKKRDDANDFVQDLLSTIDADREIIETQAALHLVQKRLTEMHGTPSVRRSIGSLRTAESSIGGDSSSSGGSGGGGTGSGRSVGSSRSADSNDTGHPLFSFRSFDNEMDDHEYAETVVSDQRSHSNTQRSNLGSIDEDSIVVYSERENHSAGAAAGGSESSRQDSNALGTQVLGGNLEVRIGAISGLKPMSTSAAIKEEEIIQLHFTSESGDTRKTSRLRTASSTSSSLSSTTMIDFGFEHGIYFETISAASNLNVEMYAVSSGGFFGKKVKFLGEIDIPLLPTADKSSKDTLVFNFSRRYQSKINRNDIVDGTMELSFNWTINLQDLLILKAQLLESELRARKEILSLLRDTSTVTSKSQQQQQIQEELRRTQFDMDREDEEDTDDDVSTPNGADIMGDQQQRLKKSMVSVDKFKGLLEIKLYVAKKVPRETSHIRETLSKLLNTEYNRGARSSIYVVMKVQSSSATHEYKTRYVDRVRSTEAEFGDYTFKINEVPGDAKIIFELYESNFLVDRLLGQGVVTLSRYADGESHYFWLEMRLPMSKQRKNRRVKDVLSLDSADDDVNNAELNIRMQWSKESAASRVQYSGDTSNVSVNMNLLSIGVAVVDFNPFLGPRELIFALIEKVSMTLNYLSDVEVQTSLSVSSVQVDNQLPYANNPVILAPTALRLKYPTLPPQSMTSRLTNRKIGFFHTQLTIARQEKSMIHVKDLLLYMGEMDISVEEYLVDTLIAFAIDAIPYMSGIPNLKSSLDKESDGNWKTYILEQSLHFADEDSLLVHADSLENYMVTRRIVRRGDNACGYEEEQNEEDSSVAPVVLGATNSRSVSSFSSSNNILSSDPREALIKLLEHMNDQEYTSSLVPGQQSSSSSMSWFYFEYAEVSAIQVNLTLTLGAKPKRAPIVDKYIASYTTAYGFQLAELDDVAFSICGLMFQDALMSRNYLIRLTTRHIVWETIRMAHKILSSVPLVGIPVEAASNLTSAASKVVRPYSRMNKTLGSGDEDLLDEGYVSSTATTCGVIATSTAASFLRVAQALSAVFLKAMFRITGLGSECFALLSFDPEFIALLQRKPKSTQEAFSMGLHEFGLGLGQGTVGLVMLPYQGAVDRDDSCIRGMGMGVVGCFTKPISGSLQLFSRSFFAAGRTIEAVNNDRIRSSNILGTRTRDPLRFANGNAVPIDHDAEVRQEERDYWTGILATTNNRRYRRDKLLDIGHVAGPPTAGRLDASASRHSLVVLFTKHRIIKVSHHHAEVDEDVDDEEAARVQHTNSVRWAIRLRYIDRIRVEVEGLRILVFCRRVQMSGLGATLLCNSVMTCYERPMVLIMDTRDHFGEMYQLFLRHCRDAMDEESVMYTIVEGAGVASANALASSSVDNAEAEKKKRKQKKAGSAADYTIMNVKE